ncbi:hypothetical protein THICB3320747 [Thiomonas sp. CB3]|nr:hypothetical protein THICB3320747 [Thiomonas sp. CB3]
MQSTPTHTAAELYALREQMDIAFDRMHRAQAVMSSACHGLSVARNHYESARLRYLLAAQKAGGMPC